MPRSGAGVYSLPAGSTAVPNTTISSADYNATLADLASDANTPRPVVAGGTGANTASAARTNLGLGTIATLNAVNFVPQDSATGAATVPVGTEAQRPASPAKGMIRFNDDDDVFEGHDGTDWANIPTATVYGQSLLNADDADAAWTAIGGVRTQVDIYTASGTPTVPTWAKVLTVVAMGAGGGGASGERRAASTQRVGGTGGAPGAIVTETYRVADIITDIENDVVSVVVGAGGAGGVSVTTNSTAGNAGSAGGASQFLVNSVVFLEALGGPGGVPNATSNFQQSTEDLSALTFERPGGGAANAITTATTTQSALNGPTGGGAGGTIDGANNLRTGGSSGIAYYKGGSAKRTDGVTASSVVGTAGPAGTAKVYAHGAGSGGAGGMTGNTAGSIGGGAGGDGGAPGGGGGGGGASTNGAISGAGGIGARGEVRLFWFG